MISEKDVFRMAFSMNRELSEIEVMNILEGYENSAHASPWDPWDIVLEKMICSVPIEEQRPPNPMHYDNTPQGDADYHDDYWQGDFDAMSYHDDMGDR